MAFNREDDSPFRDPFADSMGDEHLRESTSKKGIVDLTADSDDDLEMIPSPQKSNIIDLDEEDDDEDLRRAIALSVQEMNNSKSPEDGVQRGEFGSSDSDKSGHTLSAEESKPSNNTAPPTAFGILGLDRKKLEAERLARVAKRKAESGISPPPLRREAKLVRRDVSPSAKEPKSAFSPRLSQSPVKAVDTKTRVTIDTEAKPQATVQPSSVPSLQFPKGVVKKTWALGCSRGGDDIKIEEVLQSADVELAILSAFQWNMEWLFTKFRTRDTRFMLVMQAKEEAMKRQYEEDTANMQNIRLCFPPMDGQVNCMHSKLMLLFHPEYLRIVVPSANLVPYDWGEQGGVMENTVFLIDLPKASDDATANASKTAFYEELVYFLKASTLHNSLIAKLSKFDFKETSRYAFVHTIGGSHVGESWKRTGHCGLGRAVRSLGLRTQKPISVDFVTSSIGALRDDFMRSIYLSAQGDDGSIEYALRTSKAFPVTAGPDHSFVQSNTGAEWKKHFRVYYPSEHTVSKSKGGYQNAGTICFRENWFEAASFPKHVLHDCVSRRSGLLMHNKMLFARPTDTNAITRPDGSNCAGWAYVGSANLSESAWGRIVHDRTSKQPKLNCRNWECGVLVPIVLGDAESESSSSAAALSNGESAKQGGKEKDITQIFGTTVPVPMHVPAPPFTATLKPWYGAW